MTPIDLKNIGQIKKTFGYQGEMILALSPKVSINLGNEKTVFLDIRGARVPFMLEKAIPRHDGTCLIKLRQVDTREDAMKLIHLDAFIPGVDVEESGSDEVSYKDLPGFLVRDLVHGDIGILVEILEYPDQDILSIDAAGKEVLIPLVDDFILEVDAEARVILLDAPPGLIDIYLTPDGPR